MYDKLKRLIENHNEQYQEFNDLVHCSEKPSQLMTNKQIFIIGFSHIRRQLHSRIHTEWVTTEATS